MVSFEGTLFEIFKLICKDEKVDAFTLFIVLVVTGRCWDDSFRLMDSICEDLVLAIYDDVLLTIISLSDKTILLLLLMFIDVSVWAVGIKSLSFVMSFDDGNIVLDMIEICSLTEDLLVFTIIDESLLIWIPWLKVKLVLVLLVVPTIIVEDNSLVYVWLLDGVMFNEVKYVDVKLSNVPVLCPFTNKLWDTLAVAELSMILLTNDKEDASISIFVGRIAMETCGLLDNSSCRLDTIKNGEGDVSITWKDWLLSFWATSSEDSFAGIIETGDDGCIDEIISILCDNVDRILVNKTLLSVLRFTLCDKLLLGTTSNTVELTTWSEDTLTVEIIVLSDETVFTCSVLVTTLVVISFKIWSDVDEK